MPAFVAGETDEKTRQTMGEHMKGCEECAIHSLSAVPPVPEADWETMRQTVRDRLNVTGQGDAGSGGDIDITAGDDVEIFGKLQSTGTGSASGSGGGDGGTLFISANSGDITVNDEVTVRGGIPDGGGGDLARLRRHGT